MQVHIVTPGQPLPEPFTEYTLTSVPFNRVTMVPGSATPDVPGYIVELTNAEDCTIHNVKDVEWWAGSPSVPTHYVLRRVRIYNVGWFCPIDPDRLPYGHGQTRYMQSYATSSRLTEDSVFIAGFSNASKIYGSGNEHKDVLTEGFLADRNKFTNFTERRNVYVGYQFVVGTEARWGAHNIRFEDCAFLDCVLRMGYKGQNGDGWVTDCLLTNGLDTGIFTRREPGRTYLDSRAKAVSWRCLTFTNNTVILPAGAKVHVNLPGAPGDWTWDHNEYWSENPRPFMIVEDTGSAYVTRSNLSFDEWQALTGFDAHSVFHVGLPSETQVRAYGGVHGAAWGVTPPQPGPGFVLYPPPPAVNWEGVVPALNPIDPRITVWWADDPRDLRIWAMEIEAANQAIRHAETLTAKNAELTEALDALASAAMFGLAMMDLWRALDALMARSEISDSADFSAEYEAFVQAWAACEPLVKTQWRGNGNMPGGLAMLQAEIQALKDAIAALETAAAATEAAHQQTVTTLTTERNTAIAERDAALASALVFRGVLGSINVLVAGYPPVVP